MASSKAKNPNLLENKQTIVTNLAKTNAIGLHMFLRDKLPRLMENRRHVKMLIICGAHGKADGSIDAEAETNSLQNLKVSLCKVFESSNLILNPNTFLTFW